MNDENLIKLSYELDEYLMKTAEKYDIGALSLSAIMLARLIRLTEMVESRQDFDNIMSVAIDSHRADQTIQ